MSSDHHLAQVNVARQRAPLDSPELAEFVALLDPINELADAAPGFVWRYVEGDEPDATSTRPYGDLILVNFSVWSSQQALWDFTYRSAHLEVMRRRREWFHRMVEAHLVLWWIPAGHRPSLAEGMDRLAHLRARGPSPRAFTFREPFPPAAPGRPAGDPARVG